MRILIIDSQKDRLESLWETIADLVEGSQAESCFPSVYEVGQWFGDLDKRPPQLLLLHISDQRDAAGPSTKYIEAALERAQQAIVVCYSAGGMWCERRPNGISLEQDRHRWVFGIELADRIGAVRRPVHSASDVQLRKAVEAVCAGASVDQVVAALEPTFPEYVLACYVCALGDVKPLDGWKNGFEREVGYWRAERQKEMELGWQDRADIAKLRAFLAATRSLLEQAAPPGKV